MRTRGAGRRGLILLAAVVLAGCAAGSAEFELGQTLTRQQKWDEAIRAFEHALKLEPENRDYRVALAQAREGAAEQQLRSAKALAGGMGQLVEVERGLGGVERALQYDPQHGPSLEFQTALRERRGALLRQVEQLLAEARAYAGGEEWAQADGAVNRALGINPGNATALRLRDEINLKAVEKSVRLATQAERAEDWREAARYFEEALGRDAGNEVIRGRLQAARRKDVPSYYLGRAGEFEAAGQVEAAYGFLRTAAKYWPGDAGLRDSMDRLAREGRRRLYGEALRRAENDDWGKVYTALSRAMQAFGPASGVDGQLRSLARDLTARLYDRAMEFENQKQWGNTFLWFQSLQQVDPLYRDTANKVEQTREKLKERAALKIAVLDLDPPKAAPDSGSIVSGSIVSNLFKLGRRDFKVIEREALQSILKEISIGQAGVLDVETAKEIGKIAGIDVILVGRVLQYQVDQKDAEGNKTISVQVGTRTVPNPAYQLYLAAVQQGLKKATDPAPFPTISEPIQQLVTYKVGTITAVGYVSVSFRLVGVERGDILLAEKIDEEETFSHDYSEGVEAAGVQSVPKKVPIPTEVLNRVTEKAVGRIVRLISTHYGNRQEYFLRLGQELQRRRQFTRAVEEFMNSVASAELVGSGGQVASQAEARVEELLRQ